MLWAESPQSTCSVTREVQVQAVFGVCLPSPSVATPPSGFKPFLGSVCRLVPYLISVHPAHPSHKCQSPSSKCPAPPGTPAPRLLDLLGQGMGPEGGWAEGRTGCPFLPHSALVSVSNLGYIISAILIPLEVPGHSPSSQGALALVRGTHLHPVPLPRPPCQSPGGLQFL